MSEMKSSEQITVGKLLLPISIMAFTFVLLFGVQARQIIKDKDALTVMRANQEKMVGDVTRIQNQLTALLQGTMKLADGGNKNAELVVDRLKKAGVIPTKAPAGAPGAPMGAGAPPMGAPMSADGAPMMAPPSPAPIPAANAPEEPGPVKP